MRAVMERIFKLQERQTTVRRELLAGLTTFSTMAYIIFVNPSILSQAGMDFGAVMVATILASSIGCLVMGLWGNYPFALGPGLSMNAYFVYSVVLGQGISWQTAMGGIFVAALTLFILNIFHVRRLFIEAVPAAIRIGTTTGVGLFLAFIGLKNAGIIAPHAATFVTLGDITCPSCFLTLFGVLVIVTLSYYRIPAPILIALLLNWAIGLAIGQVEWRGIFSLPPSLAPTFLQLDLAGLLNFGMVTIILSFLFISMFDAAGVMLSLAEQGGFLNEKGQLPRARRAFSADAIGSGVGALLGTSSLTIYLESMSGIASGARSGLTAVVVGLLFLLALFIEPLASSIPAFATSPALIMIGAWMLMPIVKMNFDDLTELLPGYLVVLTIPLTYSVTTGIALGLASWPLLKVLTGRIREVHWLTWLLALIFVSKLVFVP